MISYHAMLALPHDMIGMALTAAGPQVLPTHGAVPRLGTNPIAVAVPTRHMHPFVYDVATSVVAANKLALARRLGSDIPGNFLATMDGTVIGESGPLPEEYQLLPFAGTRELGSHKGYGLAMVIDIMCSVLAGAMPAGFSGRGPGNHFVAAYSIDAFTDVDEFKDRMDWYLREMEATPPAPGYDRVMTPGQEEAEMEVERGAKGIPFHPEVVNWLESICKEMEIPLGFLEAPPTP
jgi:L-2-hydroxycarboxylate dehydrogenase (NAD+)